MIKLKLAIVNRINTINFGDRIISISFRNVINELGHDCCNYEYTGSSFNKTGIVYRVLFKMFKLLSKRFAIELFTFLDVLNNYWSLRRKKPQAIFIGGGQLLEPNRRFIPSLLAWFILSRILHVELILFSVGYEEVNKKRIKHLHNIIKFVLARADKVYLRDEYTRKHVHSITGILFPLIYDVAYFFNIKESKIIKDNVIISITNYSQISRYARFKTKEAYYEHILNFLIKEIRKQDQIFFVSTAKDDYNMFHEISTYIRERINRNVIIQNYHTEDELVNIFNNARVVISSRLHSLIVAELCHCKIVPIIGNEKVNYYAKNIFSINATYKREVIKNVLSNILKDYQKL